MFDCSSPLYSRMLRPSLILAVALTTARAVTYFNLDSPCVVREGLCDTTVLHETGTYNLTSVVNTQTFDDLKQCADECEVKSNQLQSY